MTAEPAPANPLVFLVAGLAVGLGLGLSLAPHRAAAPVPGPQPPVEVPPGAPTPAREAPTEQKSPAVEPAVERAAPEVEPETPKVEDAAPDLVAALALTQHELRELARALSDPASYRTVRAVQRDLTAYRAAERRRKTLLSRPGADALREPLPELPDGLADAALLATPGALRIPVAGSPLGGGYLAPDTASGTANDPGVLLTNRRDNRRCLVFATRRGNVNRHVEVLEQTHGDRLEVRMLRADGRTAVSRICVLPDPGARWGGLMSDLLLRGQTSHEALAAWVAEPLVRHVATGWLDWLRRHLGLPPNPELAETLDPPPALPATNPLLLSEPTASPRLLERSDLVLDPQRAEAPLPSPAGGPLVLIAANGVAVHDGAWSWLVFDTPTRRVVHHVRSPRGHLRWDYHPDFSGQGPTRTAERFAALASRAKERTRHVLSLLVLRREVRALTTDLERTVGRLYTRDGLEAVRLRTEILTRSERVQALSHLLLDARGVTQADRALSDARIETTALVADVIEGMIDAGRSGPVEYLLRNDAVKNLLFSAPQAYRLRIRRKFRERFRPWGERVQRTLSGRDQHWYE